MIVSDRSWHYRLYRYYQTDLGQSKGFKEPTNLCSYFWSLVGHTILFGIVSLIMLAAAILLALPFAIGGLIALVRRQPMPWDGDAVKRYKAERKRTRRPGLVRSYLAARKQRVCPLITVEHNTGSERDS